MSMKITKKIAEMGLLKDVPDATIVKKESIETLSQIPEQSEEYKKGKALHDGKKYYEAFLYFAGGKEKGDAWCINALGKYYEEGLGSLQKDAERGLSLVKRASALNLPAANFKLGIHNLLKESHGDTEDTGKGIELITKAAELDEPDALYFLGLCYMREKAGVPKDEKKGREFIIKAAKLKQPVAKNLISVYHLDGIYDLQKNSENEENLVIKAAELSDSAALYGFGLLYLDGMHGLPNDTKKGIELVTKAVEMEGVHALPNLAKYFLEGSYGLPKNIEKGIELITKAAEMDYPKALDTLGRYYLGGRYGLPRDRQKGTELLVRAAELRGPAALNALGKAFLDGGHSVPQDTQKGFELMTRAAELRGPDALNNLGRRVFEGTYGIPQNTTKGIEILKKAAELNHPDANYTLGNYYEKRMIGSQDSEAVLAYYKKAKEFGKEGLDNKIYNLEHFPDVTLSPEQLLAAYEKNAIVADRDYQGKLVRMSGEVSTIDKDSSGNAFITFSAPMELSDLSKYTSVFGIKIVLPNAPSKLEFVQLFFDKERIEDVFVLKNGDKTNVQGEIIGLRGKNVVIEHCWVVHEE